MEKQKKKDAHLLNNEASLLYLLVNHTRQFYLPSRFDSKLLSGSVKDFKRKPYNWVLMKHPMSHGRVVESKMYPGKMIADGNARSCFSRLVTRLISKGWIRKIRHGHNIYLKITENGLNKIRCHYEYRQGIL